MSAEVLRAAALLMRERAEAVPIPNGQESIGASSYEEGCLSLMPQGDREHAAALGPAVALAVADWLEIIAERRGTPGHRDWHAPENAALTVARAYLGETS